MKYLALLLCSLVLSTVTVAKQSPITELNITHITQQHDHVFTAGQPDQQQFAELAKKGIKTVINLRDDSEISWSEQDVVEQLGMRYFNIPVSNKDDINLDNAKQLYSLLQSHSNSGVLLHCASSNRVGALVAIYQALALNKPVDDAIAIGKQWGLKSLETVVAQQIEEAQTRDP
ncbi:beta-lactamase hydrolase domain-containing protein [Pseudoalteromonas mariniglutinosa]|uniref:fused DSP-PTPase phosphatase/NAD kinase-like protein n=1 Tax=Pseudoalteromonas mariniglutinosa TaxID=206042 RepID=UPI00384B78EE